jgi:phosphatidylglycerol---prolipoprotein diacylglyceryl transferase
MDEFAPALWNGGRTAGKTIRFFEAAFQGESGALTESRPERSVTSVMLGLAFMNFPVYLRSGSLSVHPHLVFEVLAYGVGFRVYVGLRKRAGDALDDVNRWWVIAAAAMGAVVGSRALYWFEDPRLTLAHWSDPAFLMGGKTIVGAMVGGLLAVELAKKWLGITRRTGDLFAVPICVGMAIGRIGCFLTGLDDHTSGIATTLPWGVNFGDGVSRHPMQLYEVVFALAVGAFLWWRMRRPYREGDIFKMFMVAYFGFRLLCDFLKPDVRVFLAMTSIQWACVAMLCYYAPDIVRWLRKKDDRTEGDTGGAGQIKDFSHAETV